GSRYPLWRCFSVLLLETPDRSSHEHPTPLFALPVVRVLASGYVRSRCGSDPGAPDKAVENSFTGKEHCGGTARCARIGPPRRRFVGRCYCGWLASEQFSPSASERVHPIHQRLGELWTGISAFERRLQANRRTHSWGALLEHSCFSC